ncbi:hypothetical protein VTO73DRAFT_6529 [Trametes versicolor]
MMHPSIRGRRTRAAQPLSYSRPEECGAQKERPFSYRTNEKETACKLGGWVAPEPDAIIDTEALCYEHPCCRKVQDPRCGGGPCPQTPREPAAQRGIYAKGPRRRAGRLYILHAHYPGCKRSETTAVVRGRRRRAWASV